VPGRSAPTSVQGAGRPGPAAGQLRQQGLWSAERG